MSLKNFLRILTVLLVGTIAVINRIDFPWLSFVFMVSSIIVLNLLALEVFIALGARWINVAHNVRRIKKKPVGTKIKIHPMTTGGRDYDIKAYKSAPGINESFSVFLRRNNVIILERK